MAKTGISMRQISLRTDTKYATVCKYVNLYNANKVSIPDDDGQKAPQAGQAIDELRVKQAPPIETKTLPAPVKPKDLEEVEERLEKMAGQITVGAERLLASIVNMDAEAMSLLSLKERAQTFGVLMDKLKTITDRKNPMLSSILSQGPNGGGLNIVNIIASTVPPRKKGRLSSDDADITEVEVVADVPQGNQEEDLLA